MKRTITIISLSVIFAGVTLVVQEPARATGGTAGRRGDVESAAWVHRMRNPLDSMPELPNTIALGADGENAGHSGRFLAWGWPVRMKPAQ